MQLHVEDALAAEEELRTSGGIDASALLQRAVAVGERRVLREQRREVGAAVLLLALDEEAHADRQLAVHRAVGLRGLDAKQQMSLVVVDAARVHRAVADVRLERRGLPQLERHGGLDVVVLDADERALARTRLAHDQRGLAADAELARLAFRRAQPLRAPEGRVVERRRIPGLAGDRAEVAELRDEAVAMLS